MKKKGFTVVELLAIIVVLAILSLIAVPMILDNIETSKKESAGESAKGYIDAVEKAVVANELSDINDIKTGTYLKEEIENLGIEKKGDVDDALISINKDGQVEKATFLINGFLIEYDIKKISESDNLTVTKIDMANPMIVVGSLDITTKSIIIPYMVIGFKSEIKDTTCEYGISEAYGKKGKVEYNKCIIDDIDSNKAYYYKIVATSKTGEIATKTGNTKTSSFDTININIKPSYWSKSKTVTLTGATVGSKIQYQIGSTTGEWINYSSSFKIEEKTTIYVRLFDGRNTSGAASLVVTRIDKTSPTLTIGTITGTTKSITIPYTVSDSESGIKNITCVYGKTKSYGSKGIVESDKCKINNIDSNKTYYYKITATDNVGNIIEKIGNTKTNSFDGIVITAELSIWTRSKEVTITGSNEGAKLQYQLGNPWGKWIDYTKPFTINENIKIYARLYDGVNTSSTAVLVVSKIDITKPSLTIGTISTTTKSITIPYTAVDSESGIKSTTCKYGTDGVYENKGKIENNKCIINGNIIMPNMRYYYKIETENNVGLKEQFTGAADTSSFDIVSIIATPSSWSTSKTINIIGKTEGAKLQYQINKATGEWIDYTDSFTINEKTTIYARLYDGQNASFMTTYSVQTLDKTSPTLTVESPNLVDEGIVIPFIATDSDGDLKDVVCEYGKDTNYGNHGVIINELVSISVLGGLFFNVPEQTIRIAGDCLISPTEAGNYYYKIEAINSVGMKANKTGNINSLAAGEKINIMTNPATWSKSKVITISKLTSLADGVLQYKIGNGSWQNYSEPFTITAKNTIYARVYSNSKTLASATLVVSTIDTTGPSLTLNTTTSSTKSVIIPYTVSDSESGVKDVICEYGTSTDYGSFGEVDATNKKCILNDLAPNTNYYFRLTATDNIGTSTIKTGNKKTVAFSNVSISASSLTSVTTSKKITISGTTSGAKLQYQLGSATGTWLDYTAPFTISENTTIYARLYDGHNTSSTASLVVSKIDTTPPDLTIGNLIVKTKSIAIPYTATDSPATISSVTCSYGKTESYGTNGSISNSVCNLNNLEANTTYYYKIIAKNSVSLSTTKTGVINTSAFNTLSIITSPSGWSTTKEVSITGANEGATIQYQIGSTKGSWKNYTKPFTITSNTTIYVRQNDGKNISSTSSLVVSTINFTVTYDTSGGTVTPASKTYTYSSGIKYGTLPIPTLSGATSDGWFTVSGIEVTADTVMEDVIKPFNNHTLYAHWTPTKTVDDFYYLTSTGSSYNSERKDYGYDHYAYGNVSSNSSDAGAFDIATYHSLDVTLRKSSVQANIVEGSTCSRSTDTNMSIEYINSVTGDKEKVDYSTANGTTYRIVFTDEIREKYDQFYIHGQINGVQCTNSGGAFSSYSSHDPGSVKIKANELIDPDEENSTKTELYKLTTTAGGTSSERKDYGYTHYAYSYVNGASKESDLDNPFIINNYLSYMLEIAGSLTEVYVEHDSYSRGESSEFYITLKNSKTGETLVKTYSNRTTIKNKIKIKFTTYEKETYDTFTVSGKINGVSSSMNKGGFWSGHNDYPGYIYFYGLVPNN